MSENDSNVIRIPPQKYIHILDNNSNLTKLVEGPSTYIKQTHETILDEGI
jgi:major vault protein